MNPKKVDSTDAVLVYEKFYNVYVDGLTIRTQWNGTFFVKKDQSIAGTMVPAAIASPPARYIFPTN